MHLPCAFERCAVEIVNYNLIINCIYRTPSTNVVSYISYQIRISITENKEKLKKKKDILRGY